MALNSPQNNVNNNKKPEPKYNLSEAQEQFVEKNLEMDKNFFNNLSDAEILKRFQDFLNSSKNFKEIGINVSGYTQIQKDNLVEQIIEEKNKFLFTLNKNLSDLKKIYSKEYKKIVLSKVETEISKLGVLDLKKLIKSESKRRKFLLDKDIFKKEEDLYKNKKSDDAILKEIGISKKSYDKLKNEEKEILLDIFSSFRKITISDLETLLLTLDDDKSKQNLLKYFVSSVSIYDLEKSKLMTKEIKDNFIKFIENDLNISNQEAIKFYDSLNKENIFLNLDDLKGVDFSSLLQKNSFKKQILDEYNADIEENGLHENILDELSLDKDGNIHKNFIKFVKSSDKISSEIKNQIDLLEEGNYFEVSNGEGQKIFCNLKKSDIGNSLYSKTMLFENITSDSGVRKLGSGFDEIRSYEDFFKLLKGASLNDSENKLSIKFYDKEAFKNSGIKEIIDGSEEIETYEDLLNGLNQIDEKGKDFGFEENETVIYDEEENFVFLIEKIDKGSKEIVVNEGGYGNQKISFKNFYSILKESNGKLKRDKKINTFTDFTQTVGGDFSNFKLKKGEIFDEKKDENHKFPIKTFVGDKTGLIIKKISEDSIEYVIGNIKEEKNGTRKIEKGEKSTNFTQFYKDIESFKLRPELDSKLEDQGEELEQKSGIMKRYMGFLSIYEIINSLDFAVDGVKKKLESGNRLRALKLGQKYGWFLGKDMQLYLKSRAEQEEKSLIEEISSNLKNLETGEMFEQILTIIQNKGSKDYEIIAAMMATIKYGNLYPKDLKKHSGTFMWFKLLGGTEEYRKQKEKDFNGSLKPGDKEYRNFTEEELMVPFLKDLGKQGRVRGKLWKDFAIALGNGTNEEFEGGVRQAGNQNTFKARYNEFEGFFGAREYAGAIGALEKVLAKNGNPTDMNKAPFVIAISGYGKNFNPTLVNKIQTLSYKTPYSSLAYCQTEFHHQKYVEFIRALIKNAYPDDKKMLSDFEGIFSNDNIVKASSKFWDNYGSRLAKYLSFNDSLIFDKKDSIPEFKDFYKTSEGLFTEESFAISDDDVKEGILDNNNLTYFGYGIDRIKIDYNGGYGQEPSKKYFFIYLKNLEKILEGSSSEQEKIILFKKLYGKLELKVRDITGNREYKGSPLKNELFKRGLDLAGEGEREGIEYEKFLERTYYNFASKSMNASGVQQKTKLSIDDIIGN